jgi:hypothetical protein
MQYRAAHVAAEPELARSVIGEDQRGALYAA